MRIPPVLLVFPLLPLLASPAFAESPRKARIRSHIRFLSSDLLEGRAPGERGGELAIAYVESQMERIGLLPAGEDGTFRQTFELVGVTVKPEESKVVLRLPGGDRPLRWLDEVVGVPEHQTESESLSGELVFVGHGVTAPEEKWDDIAGADLRGKVLVMLVDDPPPTAAEPDRFSGKARTYYGRWTYKLEQARRLGAVGALLVHTDESAGYGWSVVRSSWSGEDRQNGVKPGEPRLSFGAWITGAVAKEVFAAAGKDFEAELAAAQVRGFRAVPLGVALEASLVSSIRRIRTSNVLGLLPGRDPAKAHETVVVTAHWDHLGIGEPDARGDRLHNGAVDNATGVGTLLAVAEEMAGSRAPRRPVLFFATAAEESGILGTHWFAAHPLRDLAKIAGLVNVDSLPVREEPLEVQIAGAEKLDAERELLAVARRIGLRTIDDPAPEQGTYYRSDHFPFAKAGVPALNLKFGQPLRGVSAEETKRRAAESKARYHQPSDEYDPAWSLDGTTKAAQLLRGLVELLGNRAARPRWKPGGEFGPARKP